MAAPGTVSNLVFDPLTGAGSFDVTFPDGPASSTVSVQVRDSNGNISHASTIDVNVANVAPMLSLSGNANVNEGRDLAP